MSHELSKSIELIEYEEYKREFNAEPFNIPLDLNSENTTILYEKVHFTLDSNKYKKIPCKIQDNDIIKIYTLFKYDILLTINEGKVIILSENYTKCKNDQEEFLEFDYFSDNNELHVRKLSKHGEFTIYYTIYYQKKRQYNTFDTLKTELLEYTENSKWFHDWSKTSFQQFYSCEKTLGDSIFMDSVPKIVLGYPPNENLVNFKQYEVDILFSSSKNYKLIFQIGIDTYFIEIKKGRPFAKKICGNGNNSLYITDHVFNRLRIYQGNKDLRSIKLEHLTFLDEIIIYSNVYIDDSFKVNIDLLRDIKTINNEKKQSRENGFFTRDDELCSSSPKKEHVANRKKYSIFSRKGISRMMKRVVINKEQVLGIIVEYVIPLIFLSIMSYHNTVELNLDMIKM
jgi:transcriptional antiterminator Rof (Rho-off)